MGVWVFGVHGGDINSCHQYIGGIEKILKVFRGMVGQLVFGY